MESKHISTSLNFNKHLLFIPLHKSQIAFPQCTNDNIQWKTRKQIKIQFTYNLNVVDCCISIEFENCECEWKSKSENTRSERLSMVIFPQNNISTIMNTPKCHLGFETVNDNKVECVCVKYVFCVCTFVHFKHAHAHSEREEQTDRQAHRRGPTHSHTFIRLSIPTSVYAGRVDNGLLLCDECERETKTCIALQSCACERLYQCEFWVS